MCCYVHFFHRWNKVVTFVPLWVAPNLITIVGLLINIVTSLLYVYHAPQAKEEVCDFLSRFCKIVRSQSYDF
jgi:hypothetical protein